LKLSNVSWRSFCRKCIGTALTALVIGTSVMAQTQPVPALKPLTADEMAMPVADLTGAQILALSERALLAGGERNLEYGFNLLLPRALAGNRDAIRLLAKGINSNPYRFGDKINAILRVLGNEAMFGSSSAIVAWANIHDRGLDVPVDHQKAYEWYRWAAIIGSDTGRRLTAIALAQGKGVAPNKVEAVQWADRIVLARRPQAYMQLAKIFVQPGVNSDPDLGASLAIRAAEMQPSYALEAAELLLSDGVDPAQAARAEEVVANAADAGDAQALLLTAEQLEDDDVQVDDGRLIDIYAELAATGDPEAIAALGGVLQRADATDVMKQAALEILTKSAEVGDLGAVKLLSNAYFFGVGTAISYPLAAQWLGRASELGDAPSKYQLGQMYANALGVELDIEMARRLFEEAAAGGYKLAEASLMSLPAVAD
jgi:uncharacterized protein